MNILVYVSQINAIFLKDKNQISLKTLYRLLKNIVTILNLLQGIVQSIMKLALSYRNITIENVLTYHLPVHRHICLQNRTIVRIYVFKFSTYLFTQKIDALYTLQHVLSDMPTCVFLRKLQMFIFNKINKDLDFIKCLIKVSAVHLNDFFHLCVLNVT